jgi:hypothetical protein
MLEVAEPKGRILVVVLPVSPAYATEFLVPEVRRSFDEALVKAERSIRGIETVRLDDSADLGSNDYYSDLVHLNSDGRGIATRTFLAQLARLHLTRGAIAER